MQFVKNNSLIIVLAVASLVCGILMLIPVFVMDSFDFVGASQTIGIIVFFVGLCSLFVLKMCDKTKKQFNSFVLLGIGILSLVFLSIGMAGITKNNSEGALGKAYSYFASVETTVKDGEILISQKQSELDVKLAELNVAKQNVSGLDLLMNGFSDIVAGFTSGLFEKSDGGEINPATTPIKDIVAKSGMESNSTTIQLLGVKSQLVGGGFGKQTLASAPLVIAGIVQASSQYIPKLEEAIGQLQSVIDSNALEVEFGKTQIDDANAAALSIKLLYVCLIFLMGLLPIILATKRLLAKN